MKKVLFVANVLRKHIYPFHMPFLKKLKEEGYEVHVAADNDANDEEIRSVCDVYYNVPFARSPFDPRNLKNYWKLKRLMEREHFDIIHCHTPIVSALVRFACKKVRKNGTKILYTAHGFHFYKGAPLLNRMLYYPIEKLCAKQTDVIITINTEDFSLAKRKLSAKNVEFIPGVGIDIAHFAKDTDNKSQIRKALGVPMIAFLLLSIGELSKNKNHEILIRALAKLKNEDIHLLIAGEGILQKKLMRLAKRFKVDKQIHFLGYRYDIATLCHTVDLYAHPSYREGLPVALMEAMASGLPVVCSDIRGNRDLIDENGGIRCAPYDADAFARAIDFHIQNPALSQKEGEYNRQKSLNYEKDGIDRAVLEIYRRMEVSV